MSGYPLPVMSSAGSGNHCGRIPISVIGAKRASGGRIIRSVALSHLIAIYVKVYTGAVPGMRMRGCGGVGCAAVTYMMGGGAKRLKPVNNMAAGISGMIATKLGCSYKLSIAVDTAVNPRIWRLEAIRPDNGILGCTRRTIQTSAGFREGMTNTDNVILDVMLHRCV